MIVWIDATRTRRDLRVFGMTLLERLLRALAEIDAAPSEVRVELPADVPVPVDLPPELASALRLRWSREHEPAVERLARVLRGASGKVVLALDADLVVDTRVLAHFAASSGNLAYVTGEGDERCALLRLDGPLPDVTVRGGGLVALAEAALRVGAAAEFGESDFDGYVRKLRRELPPYLFRVFDEASRDRVERFLFWSNYKGSTDFLTKYVYPPIVWRLVRPLARRRVHPNWVTAVSYVATFTSIPLFATGLWLPGLTLAYVMSVLDSVDGKLARLTYTSSRFGDVFDHGLDVVHPPLWYMAWALGLSGGDPGSGLFIASLWLLGFYVLDRLCAPIFKARTGRSIHGYTPLDERMRTFISRRNVNLAAFSVALALDAVRGGGGLATLTFYVIVAWQVVGFVWHAARTIRFWNAQAAR